MKRSSRTTGFTIVELLIVVVVIAILAAITIVSYNGITRRARETTVQTDLHTAATQLELDKVQTGVYPDTKEGANSGAGLKGSGKVSLQYSGPGLTLGGYCLTAIEGDIAYYVSSTSGGIQKGVCSGHTSIALACPSGYIPVPGSAKFGTGDFCVMKYEAKNVSGAAVSQAAGVPWGNVSQTTAIATSTAACSGCHLISEAEWMTIAANVLSVSSNWSGGAVGSGYIYSGHHDNNPANSLAATTVDTDGYSGTGNSIGNQRRTLTLTNGEVIWDLAGNMWEWTTGTVTSGQPGISGESCYSWKEWSAVNVNGALVPDPRPQNAASGAGGWGSSQGVGKLYSCSSETTTQRGFVRGGDWTEVGIYDSPDTAGVLALALGSPPSFSTPEYGFRVAK